MTYEPGTLRVVAYDDQGKAVGEQTVRTAGKASSLQLSCDRTRLSADGDDLSFVTVSLVDKDGTLLPDASNQLVFEVEGAGRFKAACNGDATSLEPFTTPTMRLFHGQLVVVVQSSREKGALTLRVRDAKNAVPAAEVTMMVE